MNLVELALTTYTEGTAAQAEQDAEYAVEAKREIVRLARACAGSTLCADATSLDWQYTAEGLPEQVEEARAFLVPGLPEYLRYRIDHEAENVSFDLVRPCVACGHDRIDKVNSLFDLGLILHQDEEPAPAETAEADAVPGPLAALEALQTCTARMATLGRRLTAEHPGLTITAAYTFGHDDASSNGKLRLKADTIESLEEIARTLGVEVTDQTRGGTSPHVLVFRHVNAATEVDGIEVELRATHQLTVDEAATWRAKQDQSAQAGDA
ncbi:hypothetical protein [Streptomyces stelliscabiei]|uniref:Uncharacterized protein n=1 Tax=Streptomyces stelliscabiei TaxID=146820 RepID=A0A8I0TTH6_9ACTN|nr:hypothetical protein [Streptomyces stelliscabiei]KND29895.1 hypothetical protein IQ64_41860 [Streptomyces stelliscabiei]MBE1599749.1 hypothetical protein [Streptomyces stelliscabiei]MDX2519406.1 hypothetical protein [Streptomyces stelliscabiei]MDX2549665.1 hypothetical protein [Streptomyces stelliscabiei]MDX2616095.1 hypothetical protein [Streptomyces stelliscabiei]